MGEVKEKTIVSRVSDVDQAAFKAEAAEFRKALRALQRDRWKWACGEEPASDEALADFYRRLLPIQDRLRDWQGVLMEDELAHPLAGAAVGQLEQTAKRRRPRGPGMAMPLR